MSVAHYSSTVDYFLLTHIIVILDKNVFNSILKRKRRTYFQTIMNKINDLIEESDPKMFWKLLNSLKPEMKKTARTLV
jgi:hypothetical protein